MISGVEFRRSGRRFQKTARELIVSVTISSQNKTAGPSTSSREDEWPFAFPRERRPGAC